MQKWDKNWRENTWKSLSPKWDIIIIGGGITGAGIFTESVQLGLKCLLIEENDFASGASGASSKLVHGGLRYLKNGQIFTTFKSIRQRDQLLKQRKGLVKKLEFLHLHLKTDKLPGWLIEIGLSMYDIIGGTWLHKHYDKYNIAELCSFLNTSNLIDGFGFYDALTDDARLVFRLIREGVSKGGTALNYTRAEFLSARKNSTICKINISNKNREYIELQAKYIINATGAKTDTIRKLLNKNKLQLIRPLRGSHLVIPKNKLPVNKAISFSHPENQRPIFAIPWKGVTLFGTTDVDHLDAKNSPPAINQSELNYLLNGLNHVFNHRTFEKNDVLSTYSGLRPTINTGKRNPSKESRDFIIKNENGLITVCGGKLTTYKIMAKSVLKHINLPKTLFKQQKIEIKKKKLYNILSTDHERLYGRFEEDIDSLLTNFEDKDFKPINGTPYSLAELQWSAQNEAVEHLDDLLLRRTRIGLLLPNGGKEIFNRIKPNLCSALNWNDIKWHSETQRYYKIYKNQYSLPVEN